MAVVALTDTWILENYAQVFEASKVNEAKSSPALTALSHFAFPGVTWLIKLYPCGNSRAKPSFASVFVHAIFGSEKESVRSVWAKWTLTLLAGDAEANLHVEIDAYTTDCGWGHSNAFLQDALKSALNTDGHLEMKLDLTLFKIVDLLKCRETVRALLSDNQHTDVTVNVEGKTFKAHKAILTKRCTGFRETVPVGTAADAYSAFLRAVYCDSFDLLTNWELNFGVLRLSVEFGAVQVKEYCDDALARLIPALDFPVLLQILPEAVQRNLLTTISACIRVLTEKKELLTSTHWTKFKATASLSVFQAICDGLLERNASRESGAGELKRSCGDVLADLIPSLSFPVLLQVLAAAIQQDKLSGAAKAAGIRVLIEKKDILTSEHWTDFKAAEGIHVFQVICDALLEKSTPGLLLPAVAVCRPADVTLSYTWDFPHAGLLSATMPEQTSIISPPFLEHKAFPHLMWQLEFYPRGNTQAADYKQGFASLYLKAIFGTELADLKDKAMYAKWKATIVVNEELPVSTPGSCDFILDTGAKEIKFGYANAFQSEKFDEALATNKLPLAFKLDLTIGSIPEIIKCRDLICSLHSDKAHADIEIDVHGTIFKAHKCILAIRSAVFARLLETVTLGKVEVKDTTPQAFEAFMAGVYYDSWTFLSDVDTTIDVLNLAERYAITDLKRYCDETLAHFANESNVAKILPVAAIQNADATKLACFGILFADGKMMKSGDWIKFKTCNEIELHVSGEIVKASQSVLSTRSAVFARMFQTDMEESKNGKADIKDTTPEAFEVFLAGVYYDNWSFLLDMDATIEVLNLAERYGVADLKRYCDDALAKFANESNVLTILPHAAMQNADAAMTACMEILLAKEELLKSNGWIKFKKPFGILADIIEAAAKIYRKDRQGTT